MFSTSPTIPCDAPATPAAALARHPPVSSRDLALTLALSAVAVGCAVVAWRNGGGPGPAVMGAIAAASLISSIAGFAFSAICGAMLFHLWDDPVQVVQVMIACSIANQTTMVWTLRREIRAHDLGPFLLGGAAGVPIGVWALLHADRTSYTHVLGLLLLAYGAYTLTCTPRRSPWQSPSLDLAAGFLGGITGGAAGFPGASVTIWCSLKGWDKTRQRAAFQPFILLMQVAAMIMISALKLPPGGHRGSGFDPAILLCLPAGLFGTRAGMAFFRRMSNRQFTAVVNVLLMISGLSYLL
jgi:uncharacterized membrane protein YfcA